MSQAADHPSTTETTPARQREPIAQQRLNEHHALVRAGGIDKVGAVELRPKVIWRLISPLAAVGVLVLVWGDWASWRIWPGLILFATFAVAAQRSYIRVEDGTIYRRDLLRWDRPLVLADLAAVSLQRRWDRGDNPHIELRLESHSGVSFSFQPRWWTNADQLLRIVATSVVAEGPDQRSVWKLPLTDRTQRRLVHYL